MKKSYRNFAFGSAIVVGVGVLVFLGTQFSSWRDQLAQVGGQAFRITAIILYNTATGQDIATLTNGMIIDTTQTGTTIGFRAETTNDVEMVYFTTTLVPSGPTNSVVDSVAPYLIGDTTTMQNALIAPGTHTLRAIPYSADQAPWTQGQTVLLNYTIGTVNTPTYTLTVTKEGSGTITGTGFNCGTDCSEVFSEGAMAEVTAVPASGSSFLYWNGICSEAGATCRLPMTANETAHAVFQTTTTTDTTPPTVSLTAPASGSILGTSTTVSANASDNVGVVGVKFFSNGQLINTEDTVSPYTTVWNTSTLTPGTYTLTAIARDQAGNTTTSLGRTVTKSAPNDTTPPTVSLTAPGNGSTVSGTVTVSATASDAGSGVSGVQFKMDGQNIGAEDTTAPYAVSWDTTTTSNGSHTLTAVARDASGNTATSNAQTVTVQNQIVTTGSKISIPWDKIWDPLPTASGTTGGAWNLFDGDLSTQWTVSWDKLRPYQTVTVDLGTEYQLSEIKYYRPNMFSKVGNTIAAKSCRKKTTTEANAEASKRNPLACTNLFSEEYTGNTTAWVSRPVTGTTRYLEFTLAGANTWIKEIEVYGTRVGSTPTTPNMAPVVRQKFDEFIGVNAFPNNPVSQIAAVAGNERDYINISWLTGGDVLPVGTDGFLKSNVVHLETGSGFSFQNFYRDLVQSGVKPYVTIKECLRGGFSGSRDSVCVSGYDDVIATTVSTGGTVPLESDPFRPASYRASADLFFQFAARYGTRTISDSLLKLAPDESRVSGLRYVDTVETENEQDKTWKGIKAFHHPYMDAARTSALYDGHLDTISPNVGVKNADPNFRLSIGGLFATTSHKFEDRPDLAIARVNLMRLWSEVYRGGSIPFDIVNVHHYLRKTYSDGQQGGISPEEGELREFAKTLVDYSRTYWGGMPVWFTEFGYDTGALGGSNQGARAYGNYSVQQVQGMWLVRSFLELAWAGVDRASMYMFPDSCGSAVCDSDGLYSTSGVVGSIPGNFLPKKVSYYYMATLRSVLSGTRFTRDLSNSSVRNYEFKNDAGTKTVNVIWSPTANGASVTGYQAGGAGTLIRLSDTSTTGTSTAFAGGSLVVTEVPVFIVR